MTTRPSPKDSPSAHATLVQQEMCAASFAAGLRDATKRLYSRDVSDRIADIQVLVRDVEREALQGDRPAYDVGEAISRGVELYLLSSDKGRRWLDHEMVRAVIEGLRIHAATIARQPERFAPLLRRAGLHGLQTPTAMILNAVTQHQHLLSGQTTPPPIDWSALLQAPWKQADEAGFLELHKAPDQREPESYLADTESVIERIANVWLMLHEARLNANEVDIISPISALRESGTDLLALGGRLPFFAFKVQQRIPDRHTHDRYGEQVCGLEAGADVVRHSHPLSYPSENGTDHYSMIFNPILLSPVEVPEDDSDFWVPPHDAQGLDDLPAVVIEGVYEEGRRDTDGGAADYILFVGRLADCRVLADALHQKRLDDCVSEALIEAERNISDCLGWLLAAEKARAGYKPATWGHHPSLEIMLEETEHPNTSAYTLSDDDTKRAANVNEAIKRIAGESRLRAIPSAKAEPKPADNASSTRAARARRPSP